MSMIMEDSPNLYKVEYKYIESKYGKKTYLPLLSDNLPKKIEKYLEDKNINFVPISIRSIRSTKERDYIEIEYIQRIITQNIFTRKISIKEKKIHLEPIFFQGEMYSTFCPQNLIDKTYITTNKFESMFLLNKIKNDKREKEKYLNMLYNQNIEFLKIKKGLF